MKLAKTVPGSNYFLLTDLKAVFIERFNRTLLHIIKKPMFFNGDANWVNILNDAVLTFRNAEKRNIFCSKSYTSNWNRELFKVNAVLKTQPPTYKIEDINGEIIEGKCYE